MAMVVTAFVRVAVVIVAGATIKVVVFVVVLLGAEEVGWGVSLAVLVVVVAVGVVARYFVVAI